MQLLVSTLFTLSSIALAAKAQSYTELKPTFLDNGSKNFAFVGLTGGSSHFNWVLSIGNELSDRGHNFTFVSSDEDRRYTRPYPKVKSVSYGPSSTYDKSQAARYFELGKKNPLYLISGLLQIIHSNFERDYAFIKQYLVDDNIDVVICDHFADACVDAATTLGLPYIITGSADGTEESSAPYLNDNVMTMVQPTTEFQSISTRFYSAFIDPITTMYHLFPTMRSMNNRKRAAGIPAKMGKPGAEWKNSLKLINNLNGYIPARPVGALSEYIGPVLSTKYAPITKELGEFLHARSKVAYIAFGEKATPNTDQIVLILRSLFESMESGLLDGIIWATGDASNEFPDIIKTSSNVVYNITSMFSHTNPNVRLIKYVPQTAVLISPSTKLFISHGGLTSWYESMYSGTPMIMLPFFGDQFANSFTIATNNLGGILDDKYTNDQVIELFKNVLEDKDGVIKKSVQRYQAMTQIHSRRGVERGADLIEEVAYTNVNGRLPHRESADKRMSYIKAHNIDIYALLGVFLSPIFGVLYIMLRKLLPQKQDSLKVKKL